MPKALCEALCIVHNRPGDEGRRCHLSGELHPASGYVLCWTHARAAENVGRNYPLVCVKRPAEVSLSYEGPPRSAEAERLHLNPGDHIPLTTKAHGPSVRRR